MKHPEPKRREASRRALGGSAGNHVAAGAAKGETATVSGEAPPLRVLPPVTDRAHAPKRRTPAVRERVLVVDGHPMVEEWIGTLLLGNADLVCAGHASELSEATALVARTRPNIVLLEIARDVAQGLEVVRVLKAKFPKLRILIFSSCDEIAHAVQVLRAGAHGFVSKTAKGAQLLHAIRQVLDDGVYLSSAMIGRLAAFAPETSGAAKTGPGALLSQRELQVFDFIGEGLHPKEIAQRISVSVKTVESYLVRIRQKLDLKDARALFKEAVKWSKTDGRRP